tara:strand:+ start:630 stop:872 length:243 start_codon:yes stop_codon:yes gene_type:complete
MQMLTDDLKKKYDLEKETLPDGRIKVMLTPKHIKCYGCSKEVEFVGANLLVWIDDNNYKREARFCRTCKKELKEYGYFNQ